MAGKSSRFSVAVHVLTLLAYEEGRPLTSEYIAGSVNTNAVVIRRLLGLLQKAGLVAVTEGAGGGTELGKPARQITLADVYRAVEPGELFGGAPNKPNPLCPVGRRVQDVLQGKLEHFRTALDREMDKVTLADVIAGVRSSSRR